MKKILIGLVVVLALMAGFFYNSVIGLSENVDEAWGNVQVAYQRRGELIDNLVSTVKGAADFEKSTLTQVVAARAKATSANIDMSNVTPNQMQEFMKNQNGLSGALSKLLVSVERYPELKANQNFLKLQDELTSTENQILTARTRYNKAIKPYNMKVKKFPGVLFASIFGFDVKPYFEADQKSQKAPKVEFDFN